MVGCKNPTLHTWCVMIGLVFEICQTLTCLGERSMQQTTFCLSSTIEVISTKKKCTKSTRSYYELKNAKFTIKNRQKKPRIMFCNHYMAICLFIVLTRFQYKSLLRSVSKQLVSCDKILLCHNFCFKHFRHVGLHVQNVPTPMLPSGPYDLV